MKFLYLIQGNSANITTFCDKYKKLNLLSLTYDEPLSGSFFFPDSTYATGRNVLLQEAQKLDESYDYYVFLDDDLQFLKGSFTTFEEDTQRIQPDISMANMDVSYLYDINPKNKRFIYKIIKVMIKFAYWFRGLDLFKNRLYRGFEDSCFLAIKVSTLKDTRILPYHDDFDDTSWHIASGIMHIFVAIWQLRVYTSPNTIVSNTITEGITGNLRRYPKHKLEMYKLTKYISQWTFQQPQTYEQYFSRRLSLSYSINTLIKRNRLVTLFNNFIIVLNFSNLFGKKYFPKRAINPMKDEFFIKQKKLKAKNYKYKFILK